MSDFKPLISLRAPVAGNEFFITNSGEALVANVSEQKINIYDTNKYISCLNDRQKPSIEQCTRSKYWYHVPYERNEIAQHGNLVDYQLVDVAMETRGVPYHAFALKINTDQGKSFYRVRCYRTRKATRNSAEQTLHTHTNLIKVEGPIRMINEWSFLVGNDATRTYDLHIAAFIRDGTGKLVLTHGVHAKFEGDSPYYDILRISPFIGNAGSSQLFNVYNQRFYSFGYRNQNGNKVFDPSKMIIYFSRIGNLVMMLYRNGNYSIQTRTSRTGRQQYTPTGEDSLKEGQVLVPVCIVDKFVVYYVATNPVRVTVVTAPEEPEYIEFEIESLRILCTERLTSAKVVFDIKQRPKIMCNLTVNIGRLSTISVVRSIVGGPTFIPHDPRLLVMHSADTIYLINLATAEVWTFKDPNNVQINRLRVSDDGVVQANNELLYMHKHSIDTLRYETGRLAEQRRAFHQSFGIDDALEQHIDELIDQGIEDIPEPPRPRLPLEIRNVIANMIN